MWRLIPGWLRRAVVWASGALAFAFLAWAAGKREGRQRADTQRHKDNAEAAKESKEIRHDIETADDQRLVDILTGRRKL